MAAEPKLVVALEARLTKFEKDLKQAGVIADRQVRSIEDSFSKSNPSLGFVSGLAKGAIAAVSLQQALTGVLNVMKSVAEIGERAERVGLSAEQLQEIGYAVKLSGGEIETANGAMERFANNVAKASQGSGYLSEIFIANGVALRKSNGEMRSSADLLAELANLIKNTASPQERLNIASEAFGRGAGPSMVKALSDGSEGLARLGQEARDAGAIIRDDLVKSAEELDDKWDKIVLAFTAKGKTAIIEGIETVGRWLSAIDEWSAKVLPILQKINEFNPVSWGTDALARAVPAPGMATGPTRLTVRPDPNKRTVLPPRGGLDEGRDPFERSVDQIRKRTEILAAETAAIDLGAAAQQRARVVVELETAAKKANADAGLKNTEVTAEQRIKINELADAYFRAAQAAEAARSPLATFAREARDSNKLLQEAAVGGLRSLEDGLVEIVTQTSTVSEAFKKMANAIIADLARIAIRQAITGPLAGALGSALGSGSGGLFGNLFGGARASGGPVSAGRGYLVGENGPEFIVPKSAGMVIPNNVLRGGGSSMNITYAPSYDARGASVEAVAKLAQLRAQDQVEFQSKVIAAVRRAQSSRML